MSWKKGCLLGCGGMILIVTLLGGAGFFWSKKLLDEFGEAIEVRQELDEQFGSQDAYSPPIHISADRMEAFLAVREELRHQCAELGAALAIFNEIDQYEEGYKPSPGEIWRIVKGSLTMVPGMASYFDVRNASLAAAEMGLGEYTYIYYMAYFAWLGHDPYQGPLSDEDDGSFDRIGEVIIGMLQRQSDELAALPPGDPRGVDLERYQPEILAMRGDRSHIAWQNGLPAALEESLRPYRERLESSFCPELASMALSRNRRTSAVSIESD